MSAEPAIAVHNIVLLDEQTFTLDKYLTAARAKGICIRMAGNVAYVYIVQP